jgi:hypothetical protein
MTNLHLTFRIVNSDETGTSNHVGNHSCAHRARGLCACYARSPSCAAREKRQEAYDLLEPVWHWFTGGFDTADLQEAKILLEALA